MLRSLWLLLIYFSILGLGVGVPFVAALGYVWVDATTPQKIAYVLLSSLPVSLIMGATAFFGYILLDRRAPPRPHPIIILSGLFALWVTISTIGWAEVPDAAWVKWDWACKAVAFSAFLPFVFRSRVQIEAFLQVLLFSAMANILGPGIKTLVTGGGYGVAYGFVSDNSGMREGGFLAAVATMLIPLILYLRKHTILLPRWRLTDLGYIGLIVICLSATIGTYERTGLIGMLVVALATWLRSRRKVLFGGMIMAIALVIGYSVSTGWQKRISTIETYRSDTSAESRIEIWKWTLGYVASHPLGGGFDVYRINSIKLPSTPGTSKATVERARAFHNIYFEVLGEQGWVGLGLYAGIILSSFFSLRRAAKRAAGKPELAWCRDLATALAASLATVLACGCFQSIGFQPMVWYLFAASTCVSEHVRRLTAVPAPRAGWRARALSPTAARLST